MKRLLPLVLLLCLVVGCGSSHACSAGRETVLRAVPQRGEAVTPAGMKLVRQIITNRVDSLTFSPTVEIRGRDEIVVSGPSGPIPRVVSATGNLQFFDFEKDLAPPTVSNGNPTPYPTLYSLLTAVKDQASTGTPEAYYLFGPRTTVTHSIVNGKITTTKKTTEKNVVLAGPYATRKQLLANHRGPSGTTILAVPAKREVVFGTQANFTASTSPVGHSPDGRYWYLFRLPPEISGKDIHEATVQAGTDPNTGLPQVSLGFTKHGTNEFQAITKAEYERGQLVAGLHGSAGELDQRYVQHNAIVLDNKLQATPYIDYTDNMLSLGIAGGNMVIANLGSKQAANDIARVLQSGSLPYRLEEVSSKLCRP